MRVKFINRGIAKSESLEGLVEQRLDKVNSYFGETAECKVVYRQEKRYKICELTIVRGGDVFRCESKHEDIYVAANDAVDILWGKIRKYKSRVEKLRRDKSLAAMEPQARVVKTEEDNEPFEMKELIEQGYGDIKHKKVSPDVMSEAEAIAALDLIGHAFYIFINQETDRVSMAYKRDMDKYGEYSYGVIEVTE